MIVVLPVFLSRTKPSPRYNCRALILVTSASNTTCSQPRRLVSPVNASANAIEGLVEAEIAAGTDASKVTLAGFSQGGVIALQLGLSMRKKIAGIMALSTYVHDHENLESRLDFANLDTPIFMAHGISDPMIPITRAITSREALLGFNYSVTWHEYAMGHQVCPQEIADIAAWLNQIYS